jgi:hypothetical protein
VTIVGVITACLARASRLLQPALAWAGDWLGDRSAPAESLATGPRPSSPASPARLGRSQPAAPPA